jgi:uncharacterized protein YjbJ (UPF0337 family)
MNKEQFQGQWNQIRGKVKEKWGRLTDDEIAQINGKRDILLSHLQKKYGIAKEKAEEELRRWEESLMTTLRRREESPSYQEKEKWELEETEEERGETTRRKGR